MAKLPPSFYCYSHFIIMGNSCAYNIIPVRAIPVQYIIQDNSFETAKWLVEFYNHVTSGEKREIITRGFERAGITHALELGSSKLPELDPFVEFQLLLVAMNY